MLHLMRVVEKFLNRPCDEVKKALAAIEKCGEVCVALFNTLEKIPFFSSCLILVVVWFTTNTDGDRMEYN